jgi:hypothetical protein
MKDDGTQRTIPRIERDENGKAISRKDKELWNDPMSNMVCEGPPRCRTPGTVAASYVLPLPDKLRHKDRSTITVSSASLHH